MKHGLIHNCPVTIEDIKIAEDIFGPNIHALKGKTRRKAPTRVEVDYVEVPHNIMMRHKNVVLCGISFLCRDTSFLQLFPEI